HSRFSRPRLLPDADTGPTRRSSDLKITTPHFTGTTESPDSVTVQLLDASNGNAVIGTQTVTSGSWNIQVTSALSDGLHNIFARATDHAGHNLDSSPLSSTVDTSVTS